MIQIIAGKKGSGKTKKILAAANEATKNASNSVIFIDDDNRYMFDLSTDVRFVNAGEYKICNEQMLYGLVAGALSQNFDIATVCIDAFKKLVQTDLENTSWFFERLEDLSSAYNITFVISVSEEVDLLPEFIKKYL